MQDAIAKGNKHSAKEYAEAIDFMKRSYDSYQEVFEDYHGVLSPSSPVAITVTLTSSESSLSNTHPRIGYDTVGDIAITDRIIEDGTFLRLNNLTIGFDLPVDQVDLFEASPFCV